MDLEKTCTHENTHTVGDVPIADPVTYEYKGCYLQTFCSDCGQLLKSELEANCEHD